jgi:hypothetical protein
MLCVHACLAMMSLFDFQGKNCLWGRIADSRFAMRGNQNPPCGSRLARQWYRESNIATCIPCGCRKARMQPEVPSGRPQALFFPAQKLFHIKSHPFVHINQKFGCYFPSDKVIVASLGFMMTGPLQIGTFHGIHRPFRARCIFKLFWRSDSTPSWVCICAPNSSSHTATRGRLTTRSALPSRDSSLPIP